MKNLFKKKKSDNKLAPQPIQYDTTPKKPIVLGDTPLQAPPLMMPKPKRALTPTRAILGRFDNDKTEVEESPLQDISPILLPTAHHGKLYETCRKEEFVIITFCLFLVVSRFQSASSIEIASSAPIHTIGDWQR
jgi:hypothetical protein